MDIWVTWWYLLVVGTVAVDLRGLDLVTLPEAEAVLHLPVVIGTAQRRFQAGL